MPTVQGKNSALDCAVVRSLPHSFSSFQDEHNDSIETDNVTSLVICTRLITAAVKM